MEYQFKCTPTDDRFDLEIFKGLKGVTVDNGAIYFDSTWTEDRAEKALSYGEPVKKAAFTNLKKQFEPDAEDRAILKGMGIEEDDFADLTFIEIKGANTMTDRDRERFTPKFLDKLAELGNHEKPSILFQHNAGFGIFGRSFKFSTEIDGNGITWLNQKAFIDNEAMMPNGVNMAKAVKRKTVKHVSHGFAARVKLEELADGSYIGIFDDDGGPVEFIETSMVHLGAQRDAAVKSYTLESGNAPGGILKIKKSQKMEKFDWQGKSFSGEAPDVVTALKAHADATISDLQAKLAIVQKAADQVTEMKTKAWERIQILQGKDCLDLPAYDKWTEEEAEVKSLDAVIAKRDALEIANEQKNGSQFASKTGDPNNRNNEPIEKAGAF